jgi:hypothetical protein
MIPYGALYQLRFKIKHPVGSCVNIGPVNDHYGYVISHKDTNTGGTLHLIRGTGDVQCRVNSKGELTTL